LKYAKITRMPSGVRRKNVDARGLTTVFEVLEADEKTSKQTAWSQRRPPFGFDRQMKLGHHDCKRESAAGLSGRIFGAKTDGRVPPRRDLDR